MKTLLFTTLVAATAAVGSSVLLVQAQDRHVVKPERPSEPVLPQFLQEEVIEFPGNLRAKTRNFTGLDSMHDTYFNDFASKPGFGASRIQFLPPQDYLTLNGETYRFAAPDLLGLEDEPIGYKRPWGDIITAAQMSKKEARVRLKRRQLTEVELRAVAELRSGKNMVTVPGFVAVRAEHVTNNVAGLLAVGALRAKTQCAECHQCKEGTLLGAFSYTLVPTNSIVPRVLAAATASR
ncbi:MAG: hypothetical protein HY300_03240 [Verrucomicrobia bacterium]|nr:hypothetical protein [Verrucomicrobiota bacterium]